MKFKGVNSPEQAQSLRGLSLYVMDEDLPPPEEGEFYIFELDGFEILLENGEPVGVLRWIEKKPGQDLLHIESTEGKEILLPFVKEFVKGIDREKKKITVRLPKGLIDG